MQDRSEDNVLKIKRFLCDQDFQLEETENGVNVKFDSGHVVDIYALARDSDVFWASVETEATDPKKRAIEIATIRDTLFKGLQGIADLGEFEERQNLDDRFVYVADLEMKNAVTYHGIITIGEEPQAEEQAVKMPDEDQAPGHENAILQADAVKPPSRSPVAKALEQLESVDGKMLRQGLDMMNLRRSSNVRLVMTRIFRSAVSEEELTRAIKTEAKKIVSPQDRDELEMIRVLSANGFLEPVVELLYREVFRGH